MNPFLYRFGSRTRVARVAGLLYATLAVAASLCFAGLLAGAGANPFVATLLPVALWAFAVSKPNRAVLGLSYPEANALTKAQMVADTPAVEQVLWTQTLFLNEDMQYEENPFVDNMTGKSDQKKAILEILDTKKVHGTLVNVPLLSGLDGQGTFGDGTRQGNDMQYVPGNFAIKVGRTYFSVAWTVTAESETMQGGVFMERVNRDLAAVMARRRASDICMNLRSVCYTTAGAPNLVWPLGVSGTAALTNANGLLTTAMVSGVNEILPGLGASPMNVETEGSGSERLRYMGLIQSVSLGSFSQDPKYLAAVTGGDIRGDQNALFTGAIKEWDSTWLYRWNNKDQKVGAIGNPFWARAKLGVAITAAASGTVVQGGGVSYNSTVQAGPAPKQYFRYFKASPYTCWNGDVFAATNNVTYYIAIINPNGTYGVFPYQVNDSMQITLTGGQVGGIAAPGGQAQTLNFVVGALILQCNVLGTYLNYSLFFGQNMIGSGVGSLNGADEGSSNLKMGSLKKGELDEGSTKYVGSEAVWGCRVVNDWTGGYPNFLLLEHAILPANAPALN
jgi:hypothetical protein